MKKLTLALLSLMLFLAMGTAFAQTLPTPAFTPASGATVAPGTVINFTIPAGITDDDYFGAIIMYTEDASAPLEATSDELLAAAMEDAGISYGATADGDGESSPRLWKTAMYDLERGMWWSMVSVSAEATGTVTLRMRLAAPPYKGDVLYSDEMSATYTIASGAVARPDAPTFSPAGGAVPAGTPIQILGGVPAAFQIPYYIVNGSDADFNLTFEQLSALPENAALKPYYTAEDDAPTVNEAMTLKAAIAQLNPTEQTLVWSEITTATFTVTGGEEPEPTNDVPVPVFNPDGGEILDGTPILLTNGTESDATPKPIYYNFKTAKALTDIKTKTDLDNANRQMATLSNAKLYSSAGIQIKKDQTINAATADIDENGNVIWSAVVTKAFTYVKPAVVKPAAPVFNPDGGKVAANQKITLTQSAGEDIYYCLNGEESDFLSWETSEDLGMAEYYGSLKMYDASEGIVLTEDATVWAAAVLYNDDETITWSDIISREFTVEGGSEPVEEVAIPVISPGNDQPVHMGDKVTIECATEGAEIYYTTNGSAPFNMDKDGYPVSVKEGDTVFKYTEPFELTEDMLIKQNAVWAIKIRAVAVKGTAISSNGGSAGYNVYPNNPTFSVEAGEVEKGTKVEITCIPSQAVIYYTIDGTTPTMESGLVYTEAIELTEDVTVKAIAVLGQYQSSVVTAAYTVTEPVVEPVEAPVFNPAAGEVEKGTKVSIACATEGAVIYYTVNGSEPTAESTEYKDEIAINEDMTIKAIAIKGESKSEVVEAAYTIDFTANEDEELAGVSVYPNPSNGLFNIELPVAATIEVFASNGVLTQRVNAAAGVFTLTLDRSGIYFLRITGEGRTAIKRVVVR